MRPGRVLEVSIFLVDVVPVFETFGRIEHERFRQGTENLFSKSPTALVVVPGYQYACCAVDDRQFSIFRQPAFGTGYAEYWPSKRTEGVRIGFPFRENQVVTPGNHALQNWIT